MRQGAGAGVTRQCDRVTPGESTRKNGSGPLYFLLPVIPAHCLRAQRPAPAARTRRRGGVTPDSVGREALCVPCTRQSSADGAQNPLVSFRDKRGTIRDVTQRGAESERVKTAWGRAHCPHFGRPAVPRRRRRGRLANPRPPASAHFSRQGRSAAALLPAAQRAQSRGRRALTPPRTGPGTREPDTQLRTDVEQREGEGRAQVQAA